MTEIFSAVRPQSAERNPRSRHEGQRDDVRPGRVHAAAHWLQDGLLQLPSLDPCAREDTCQWTALV